MRKIDKVFEHPYASPESKGTLDNGKPYVLLFGCTKLADKLILLFKSHDIDYLQIEDENQLDKTKSYSHLFAISDSDLDNLLISTIANKVMGIYEKIAVCNSSDNLNIYKQNNIRYLYEKNIDADTLFHSMFPLK